MVSIREMKYQKIGNKALIGIELESKEEGFYKNNYLNLEIFSKGISRKVEKVVQIPSIIGTGVFYCGFEHDIESEFEDLKVEFIEGTNEYEETLYDKIEWTFDKFIPETRTLVYTIINHNSDTIESATLNLVFYNKGIMLCGTSVELDNILSERKYYFEYMVPKEIDYTEVNPYIMLPNTNILLFDGFFKEYIKKDLHIKDLSKKIEHKKVVEFNDPILMYDKQIKIIQDKKRELQQQKSNSKFKTIIINILKLLLNIFKSIPSMVKHTKDLLNKNIIITILSYLICIPYGLLTLITTISFLGNLIFTPENLGTVKSDFLLIVVLPIILWYLIHYVYYCVRETCYLHFNDYTSLSLKKSKLKEYDDEIEKIEEEKKEARDKKDNYVLENKKANEEVSEMNNNIDKENMVREENLRQANEELDEYINKYSKYKGVLNYTNEDKEIVLEAIEAGAMNYEEIEDYRKKVLDLREQAREEARRRQEEINRDNRRREEMNSQLATIEAENRKNQIAMQASLKYQREEQQRTMKQLMSHQRLMAEVATEKQIKLQKEENALLKDASYTLDSIYNNTKKW